MLGSLDCTHWEWEKCPTAWKGAFQNRDKGVSVILEAVATQDKHIWHRYFAIPGFNNEINVPQNATSMYPMAGWHVWHGT